MYGTRGANGVLIVKTKSGSDLDRPIIGVRLEGYVNTPTKKPEIVDGPTYMRLYNEAVTNQGTGLVPIIALNISPTPLPSLVVKGPCISFNCTFR